MPTYHKKTLDVSDLDFTKRITKAELAKLRVPNLRDKYSHTDRPYALTEELNLTVEQSFNFVQSLQKEYKDQFAILRHKNRTFDEYIRNVLRWLARGLPTDVAILKVTVEAEQRLNWAKTQSTFWSKKKKSK